MHYGYIGLGNLGGHLAMSLLRNGFKVTVYDLDTSLAERHLKAGASWAASPKDLAAEADHVFTCLPSPTISEYVLMHTASGVVDDIASAKSLNSANPPPRSALSARWSDTEPL